MGFSQQYQEWQDSLQVPNGEVVPMGCESHIAYTTHPDFMSLPDGSIVNLQSRRVVHQANNQGSYFNRRGNGMWVDDNEWHDEPIQLPPIRRPIPQRIQPVQQNRPTNIQQKQQVQVQKPALQHEIQQIPDKYKPHKQVTKYQPEITLQNMNISMPTTNRSFGQGMDDIQRQQFVEQKSRELERSTDNFQNALMKDLTSGFFGGKDMLVEVPDTIGW